MMTKQQSQVISQATLVTPDLAATFLEANTHNRKIVQSTVDKYARDMAHGRWKLTHQGIAFNCDGTLIDGQQRLWAILDSGRSVWMMVTRGLPVDVQLVIDDQRPREAKDYLTLTDDWGTVLPIYPAVLKRMLAGANSKWPAMTHAEMRELFQRHHEAIEFSIRSFPSKKQRVTCASVFSVIARAFYSKFSKEKITRFCAVMSEGSASTPAERGIIALRDQLIAGQPVTHTAWPSRSIYLRTQGGLMNFLRDRSIKAPKETVSGELFPIPDDTGSMFSKVRKSKKPGDAGKRKQA